jgi:hypothetical protein
MYQLSGSTQAALDHNSTIIGALELSEKKWGFCCELCCWRTSRMIEGERSDGCQYWVWVIASRGGSSQLRRSFGPCDGI